AALTLQAPVIRLYRVKPALPNEKLVVDDKVVPTGVTELRLDPGVHTLVLTAPGRLPFETTFEARPTTQTTVQVQEPEAPATTPVQPPTSPPLVPEPPYKSPRKRIGQM